MSAKAPQPAPPGAVKPEPPPPPPRRSDAWFAVPVEDQKTADKRVPELLQVSGFLRFVIVEPLLGPLDLRSWLGGLDWVVVGGETGPKARPCDVDWVRSVIQQCSAGNVPCFVKQLGSLPTASTVILDEWGPQVNWRGGRVGGKGCATMRDSAGADPSEWPEDLRVREYPRHWPARLEQGGD